MPTSPIKYEPTVWGTSSAFEDFQCPSGQWCQVRRLGITDMVANGLLEQFDALSPALQESVIQPAKGKIPQDHKPKKPTRAEIEAAQNASVTADSALMLMQMMDKVAVAVVVQPALLSPWEDTGAKNKNGAVIYAEIPPEERVEGVTYADSVSLGDKMALLNWAMDGIDLGQLAQFRDTAGPSVDNLADEQDIPQPPKRPTRAKSAAKSGGVSA